MPASAYLAQFLVALILGFTLFNPAEVKFTPQHARRSNPAKRAPAQDSCPIVINYFPRIGYSGYGLTIQGENLGGVTEVMFANDIAAKFEILSNREIAVIIPLGAVSGSIVVRKKGCPDAATNLFTIPPLPEISLAPESQDIPAGNTAPISVNFSNGMIVSTILAIQTSNPDVASAPTFLVVPLGARSTAFDVTGIAVGAPATITVMLPPNLGGRRATSSVSVTSPIVRVVRVAECRGVAGGILGVPLEVDALGDEEVFRFSLTFDPAVLSNPQVSLGMSLGNGTITADTTQTAQGRVGIDLVFPPGEPLAPGHKQIVFVSFDIAENAPAGETPLGFGDQPTVRLIRSARGVTLPSSFPPGTATIERSL